MVSPVLHIKVPVKLLAVNTVLPQLFEAETEGTVGIDLGAAVPLPEALVQPLTVCVTVRVLAMFVVMEVVVAPVLHNNVPVKPLAVNVELPQLLVTVTMGAVGIVLGAAVPLPAALVHPFTVCVTV